MIRYPKFSKYSEFRTKPDTPVDASGTEIWDKVLISDIRTNSF